jgi:hypothetical protein
MTSIWRGALHWAFGLVDGDVPMCVAVCALAAPRDGQRACGMTMRRMVKRFAESLPL